MLKNILVGLGVFFVLMLLAAVVTFYRSGYFSKIVIEEKEVGPYMLVYEEHIGDYKNTKKIHENLYYALKGEKVETTIGFGIYYDNPREVSKEKLRSDIGMILDSADYRKIDQLKAKYKVREISRQKSVVIGFPFKSSLSIMAGIFKAYPALLQYVKEKNYKQREMMEIYDMKDKKIWYIMPL
jgi:hypothetical protein